MIVPQHLKDLLSPRAGRKMIFVHTPKCGGTYVNKAFGRRFHQCPTLTWPEAAGHKLYTEYRDIFRARGEDIHDHYLFSVIRNPFDWHVSWFNYIRQDEGGRKSGHRIEAELFKRMSFADYVNWLEDPSAPSSPQGYIRRNIHDWLSDETGTIRVDRVLRHEHLRDDFAAMIAETGILVRPGSRRRNVSNRSDFRSFYGAREVDIIAARHARDCMLFGYTFE